LAATGLPLVHASSRGGAIDTNNLANAKEIPNATVVGLRAKFHVLVAGRLRRAGGVITPLASRSTHRSFTGRHIMYKPNFLLAYDGSESGQKALLDCGALVQ
jgi:hypothetical protein